jgi:hypothetical protein
MLPRKVSVPPRRRCKIVHLSRPACLNRELLRCSLPPSLVQVACKIGGAPRQPVAERHVLLSPHQRPKQKPSARWGARQPLERPPIKVGPSLEGCHALQGPFPIPLHLP